MRTYDEINAEIREATRVNDVQAMRLLAAEMQELGTPTAEAAALNSFANVAKNTSDYATALTLYRQALALQEELGNRGGVATITGNMGNVFQRTGDLSAALEHYRTALDVFVDLGDGANVAMYTSNVGNVYLTSADYPSALEYYRRAMALNEEVGDRNLEAHILGSMGNLYASTADFPAAFESYSRALAIYEELGNRTGVAHITGNIGIWHTSTNNYTEAREWFQRTVTLHEELNDRAGVARATGNLITVLMELARYEEAEALLKRQVAMQMENPGVRAHHHFNYAMLAVHKNDLNVAHQCLMEALSITTNAGVRSDAAQYHEKLRDLAQKRNDFAGYIEHNNEYQRIAEEVRGKRATQRLTMMESERRVEAVERERQKERALLYGALPKSVADRMIRGEDVSGDHFDHAAVMFLDIVGFTSHTSSMPPSDVVKMLENIFRTIDAICDTNDVVKVKTIGDSYMCFRGDADASTNALSVALVAMEVMRHNFTWPDGTPLQFRIGMHIGPATAGVIGTQRLQYDVWGDTVNVASRMESTGAAGRVHVSEAFTENLRDLQVAELSFTDRGEIDVKGKGPMRTLWMERA